MGRVSEGVCRGQRPLESRAGPDSRLQPDEPLAPHKCKPAWATQEQVSHQLGSAGSLSKNPHPGSGPHQVRDSLHWPRSPPPSAQDARRAAGHLGRGGHSPLSHQLEKSFPAGSKLWSLLRSLASLRCSLSVLSHC